MAPIRPKLSNRQVDLLLGIALIGCVSTGLVSWTIGTGWARWWTATHAGFGLSLLVLAPAKVTGSVRSGLRRNRITRSISVLFGVLVLITILFGVAHSTGAWTGVGYWSPLWTHTLLGLLTVPLFAWHVLSRPVRVRRVDVGRRLFVGAGAVATVSAIAVAGLEGGLRLVGSSGRRFTGSREVGSYDPDEMPSVAWLNDRAPRVDTARWPLEVAGERWPVARLTSMAAGRDSLDAALDCTGGWYSRQRWDVVAVDQLLDQHSARSFKVTSATGYSRIFPMRDAAVTYLATGYDGRPLRRGHGAPVRLVAPARRGPWWVKWVVEIEPTDRPWWLQLPLPPT